MRLLAEDPRHETHDKRPSAEDSRPSRSLYTASVPEVSFQVKAVLIVRQEEAVLAERDLLDLSLLLHLLKLLLLQLQNLFNWHLVQIRVLVIRQAFVL